MKESLLFIILPLPSPPPPGYKYWGGGGGVYIGITLLVCPSVCPSVLLSDFVQTISRSLFNHLNKLGMVVYYHEAECPVQKLVHYLQCQGHSEGLYKQNMTTFIYLLNCWSVCNQT